MRIDISRVTRVPEHFPADEIESQIKKLLVILDAYGVGLGFDLGEDAVQSAKDMVLLAIKETERLRQHLRYAAARLGLEFPEEMPLTRFEPAPDLEDGS